MRQIVYQYNINDENSYDAKRDLKMFYIWMINQIIEDTKVVKENEYSYLIKPFDSTKNTIAQYDRQYQKKYMYMGINQTIELSNYLEHTKKKYEKIDSIPLHRKNIHHYNRLLSWYAKTPKNIDSILTALLKASLENSIMNKEQIVSYSSKIPMNKSGKNINKDIKPEKTKWQYGLSE